MQLCLKQTVLPSCLYIYDKTSMKIGGNICRKVLGHSLVIHGAVLCWKNSKCLIIGTKMKLMCSFIANVLLAIAWQVFVSRCHPTIVFAGDSSPANARLAKRPKCRNRPTVRHSKQSEWLIHLRLNISLEVQGKTKKCVIDSCFIKSMDGLGKSSTED